MEKKLKGVHFFNLYDFVLASVLLVVAGCGGGGSSGQYDEVGDGPTENTGEVVEDNQDPVFDCSNLDHDKVYAIGTFQEAAGYLDVLFDPEEPSSFCTGFAGHHTRGVISKSGKYYYGGYEQTTGDAVFTYNPDDIQADAEAAIDEYALYSHDGVIWHYPKNAYENDEYLISAETACGIRNVFIQPDTDFKFYTCPNDILHAEDLSAPFHLWGDKIISITPDGLAVVAQSEDLLINDMQGNVRKLGLPAGMSDNDLTFIAAKNFTDISNMRRKMWLVVSVRNIVADETTLHRWTLDLINEEIVDDGIYAELPDTMNNYGVGSGKIDGLGNYWQKGNIIHSGLDVIVKRTFNDSTIVFYEGDYDGQYSKKYSDLPPIYLHGGGLVGGM